jgi:hypothetical protein
VEVLIDASILIEAERGRLQRERHTVRRPGDSVLTILPAAARAP